ncbi:MAG: hypothetical protein ACOC0E_04340, partial [Spirochaetota bacterium]
MFTIDALGLRYVDPARNGVVSGRPVLVTEVVIAEINASRSAPVIGPQIESRVSPGMQLGRTRLKLPRRTLPSS